MSEENNAENIQLSAVSEFANEMANVQSLEEVMTLIVNYFKSVGFTEVHIASQLEEGESKVIEQEDSWFIPFIYEGSQFRVRIMKPEGNIDPLVDQLKAEQLRQCRQAVVSVLKLRSSVSKSLNAKIGQAAHDINNGLSVLLSNLNAVKKEGLIDEMQLIDDSLEGAERIRGAVLLLQGSENMPEKERKLTQEDFEVFMEGKTILHIEDEEAIRTIVKRVCGEDNVESVASGEEGMRKLEEGSNPDMIICDMVMTGMMGKDVYDKIKKHYPELLDRFCFFTGGGGADPALREFLEDTKVFIIDKPLGPEKLRSKVVEFFRLKSD